MTDDDVAGLVFFLSLVGFVLFVFLPLFWFLKKKFRYKGTTLWPVAWIQLTVGVVAIWGPLFWVVGKGKLVETRGPVPSSYDVLEFQDDHAVVERVEHEGTLVTVSWPFSWLVPPGAYPRIELEDGTTIFHPDHVLKTPDGQPIPAHRFASPREAFGFYFLQLPLLLAVFLSPLLVLTACHTTNWLGMYGTERMTNALSWVITIFFWLGQAMVVAAIYIPEELPLYSWYFLLGPHWMGNLLFFFCFTHDDVEIYGIDIPFRPLIGLVSLFIWLIERIPTPTRMIIGFGLHLSGFVLMYVAIAWNDWTGDGLPKSWLEALVVVPAGILFILTQGLGKAFLMCGSSIFDRVYHRSWVSRYIGAAIRLVGALLVIWLSVMAFQVGELRLYVLAFGVGLFSNFVGGVFDGKGTFGLNIVEYGPRRRF